MASNTTEKVLVKTRTQAEGAENGKWAHEAEPAFLPLTNVSLAMGADDLEQKTADYLARAVASDPSCLLTHVQRIDLHTRRKESARTYGAIVDLWIVLGGRGEALRKRLLNQAKPCLDVQHHSYLEANFRSGVSATDVMPNACYSVLSKSISGTTELVTQIKDEKTPMRDGLQEARECLEYGQLDEAQRILEEAIREQPMREEIHHDLLEVYRYTANKAGFDTVRDRLRGEGNPLLWIWESMESSFDRAVNQ